MIKYAKLKLITIESLIKLKSEIIARQKYDYQWLDEDGNSSCTDVSYAIDGIEKFVEELLRRCDNG